MACKIEFTKGAYKDFACLSDQMKRKIGRAIDGLEYALEKTPHNAKDVKKLKTPFPGYRIRQGDYRILFTVKNQVITIYSIKHRKDAYK